MKILFIGSYRESTGWGQAARDYILALDAIGLDVVPRCVKLGTAAPILPERLLELEQKSSVGCNICIQNVLPHLMDYSGHFKKNIALYFTETNHFEYSSWPQKINCMDEAWVPNSEMVQTNIDSGIAIPTNVVPCPTNIEKFYRSYEEIVFPETEDKFIFYFIGDLTRRKNLAALLKAFHLTFTSNDPVSLVIKATKYGWSTEEVVNDIKHTSNTIKNQLRLYSNPSKYISEIIVGDHLSEEQLYGLHTSCDCFVMPSYGEAWNIPAFDAMAFGNTPICSNTGGMADYIPDELLVDTVPDVVFGVQDSFQDLFTANEEWRSISVSGLSNALRRIYNIRRTNTYSKLRNTCMNKAMEYSYENIGQTMEKLLCQ